MSSQSRKRPADTQEATWVADEDRFVLQQAKKKAAIRVKEGRAKPIDWLAVTLRFTDLTRSAFDDEVNDAELDIVDPEGVFEGLNIDQLTELEKDIDIYASLESERTNVEFWHTMGVICKDKRKLAGPKGRSQDSVSSDVDKLFSAKSLTELEKLESQVKTKLRSDEPVDVEYWENLLQSLVSWKARAKLRSVSQAIVDSQLNGRRQQQAEEAFRLQARLSNPMQSITQSLGGDGDILPEDPSLLDPPPLLKVFANDSKLPIQNEADFLRDIVSPATEEPSCMS